MIDQMKVLGKESCIQLTTQGNGKQNCRQSQVNIKLPQKILGNRSAVLKFIPIQKMKNLSGTRSFWMFLITFLQFEYFNSLDQQQKEKQLKLIQESSLKVNAEHQQEDSLSIASSSVNIRQRKVSFGIILPQVTNDAKSKVKKQKNYWVTQNLSHEEQTIAKQLKKERQNKSKSMLKKFKIMVYNYARKQDQLLKKQSESHQKKSHHQPSYIPVISIRIAKALQQLFPIQISSAIDRSNSEETKNLKTKQLKTIFELMHNQKQTQCSQFSNDIEFLLQLLDKISEQLVKQNSSLLRQKTDNKNITRKDYFFSNFQILLKRLQLEKDYIIQTHSHSNKTLNQLNPNQNQAIHSISFKFESKLKYINLMDEFFIIVPYENGCIFSINVQKSKPTNEQLRKLFKRSLLVQEKIKNNQKQQLNSNDSPTSLDLQLSSLSQHPTSTTTNQVINISVADFIQNFNHRYFKNQKLIYKQKSKLQQRFKQQQLIEQIIPLQGYNEGYQILINSKTGSIPSNKLSNSRKSDSDHLTQNNNMESSVNIGMGDSIGSFRYQRQNTAQFGDGFSKDRFGSGNKQRQNIQTLFGQKNRYSFFQEYQQIVEQSYIEHDHYQNNQQTNNNQTNQKVNNASQNRCFENNNRSRQTKVMSNLISRQDFQISDNEILDDIERVLIWQ